LKIVRIRPQTDSLWERLVQSQKSTVFHSPEWMEVLTDTYDFDIRAQVLVNEAGEPEAGIPFCQIEDIKKKRLVTLPFSDYCDPLLESYEQWTSLTEPFFAENCPYTIRCVHNDVPLADDRFQQVDKAKWHGLDLNPDLDSLWHGVHSSARRAIRKAEREGVIVRIAEQEEDLRAFFELHLGVRKYKYRMVAQPYRFFESIWRHFIETQQGLLMVAIHQDKIIGGVLFLVWKNRLYYKFNASAPINLAVRPNDLMIWEGIKYGKTQDYTYLDFGLSDWDQEGLVRYKRKFATEEKTISFLRYEPDGGPTYQEQQLRRLFPQLTDLFTDESVPDTITEKAGEILYRFFT